jgi:hypothetical protein
MNKTFKVDIYELKKIGTISMDNSGAINGNTIIYNGKPLKLIKFYVDKVFRPEFSFSNDILYKDFFSKEIYGNISDIQRHTIYPYYPYQEIVANQYMAIGYIAIDFNDIPIEIRRLIMKTITISDSFDNIEIDGKYADD